MHVVYTHGVCIHMCAHGNICTLKLPPVELGFLIKHFMIVDVTPRGAIGFSRKIITNLKRYCRSKS